MCCYTDTVLRHEIEQMEESQAKLYMLTFKILLQFLHHTELGCVFIISDLKNLLVQNAGEVGGGGGLYEQ